MTQAHLEPWMRTERLAEQIGRSAEWVERAMAEGLPHMLLMGDPRFRLSDVEQWMRRSRRRVRRIRNEEWERERNLRKFYAYAIRAGDHGGPIKLGVAGSPTVRLRELQVGNPLELHLIAAWPASMMDEQRLHERFAAQRIRGEWFAHSDELDQFVRELDQP